MVTLRLLLSLAFFSTAHAEDFTLCAPSPAVCRCSSKKESAVPIKFRYGTAKIIACRPLISQITETLANPIHASAPTCVDPSPDTLFDLVSKSIPNGCGHKWENFNKQAFQELITRYVEDGTVLCDPAKYPSMCTSAVFLAFVKSLKDRRAKDLITQEQFNSWALVGGPAWIYLNSMARPDLLFETLKLGTGKTLRRNELPDSDWPREGDFLQIWREDQSGHATIFAGYLKDTKGVTKGICYWSSNQMTKGYGKRCESLSVVNRIIVGRFDP